MESRDNESASTDEISDIGAKTDQMKKEMEDYINGLSKWKKERKDKLNKPEKTILPKEKIQSSNAQFKTEDVVPESKQKIDIEKYKKENDKLAKKFNEKKKGLQNFEDELLPDDELIKELDKLQLQLKADNFQIDSKLKKIGGSKQGV